mmetsp:Transcript_54117/g.128863  ORF Transcript_54117/g.128863 Transcript_54117/m.128863 type:complete len:252 (+) Transcript_54117:172-927(+)
MSLQQPAEVSQKFKARGIRWHVHPRSLCALVSAGTTAWANCGVISGIPQLCFTLPTADLRPATAAPPLGFSPSRLFAGGSARGKQSRGSQVFKSSRSFYNCQAVDPWSVLGVSKTATRDELKAAYKQQIRKAHPDVGGSTEEFLAVKEAYRKASDAARQASGSLGRRAQPQQRETASRSWSTVWDIYRSRGQQATWTDRNSNFQQQRRRVEVERAYRRLEEELESDANAPPRRRQRWRQGRSWSNQWKTKR